MVVGLPFESQLFPGAMPAFLPASRAGGFLSVTLDPTLSTVGAPIAGSRLWRMIWSRHVAG